MTNKSREYYVAVDSNKQEVFIATTKTQCAKWFKVDVSTIDRWLKEEKRSKGRFITKAAINSLQKPWAKGNMDIFKKS